MNATAFRDLRARVMYFENLQNIASDHKSRNARASSYDFKLVESHRDGSGIRMSGVNNRKFIIDFRSSQVRQAHSCIR